MQFNKTTVAAITAVVMSDPEASAEFKAQFLDQLNGKVDIRAARREREHLYSVREVAQLIGKSAKRVHDFCRAGIFQKVTLKGLSRASGILASSVDAYLNPGPSNFNAR